MGSVTSIEVEYFERLQSVCDTLIPTCQDQFLLQAIHAVCRESTLYKSTKMEFDANKNQKNYKLMKQQWSTLRSHLFYFIALAFNQISQDILVDNLIEFTRLQYTILDTYAEYAKPIDTMLCIKEKPKSILTSAIP